MGTQKLNRFNLRAVVLGLSMSVRGDRRWTNQTHLHRLRKDTRIGMLPHEMYVGWLV